MAAFSHIPLQKSLFQTLTEDTTLMGIITGVYDHVPQGTDFPYVVIGDSQIKDWSCKTSQGSEQVVSLYIWSREGGRMQAATIMERIYLLLHGADLSVEGQTLISFRFLHSDIALGSDGWTYKGTLQFRALLESNT